MKREHSDHIQSLSQGKGRRKRIAALAAALGLALGLSACGGAQSTGTTEAEEPDIPAITLSSDDAEEAAPADIYDAIAAEVALPEMYLADDDFLMNYYGIDAALLDDYVFASCEDAARVDTVILMRLADAGDAQTVTDGLNGLLDQMEIEMDNYLPEAHALVTAAQVRQNGRFLDLVISEDRDAILAVIDRMTK